MLTLSDFVGDDNSALAESYLVTVQSHDLRAETRASSFMAPSLSAYFHDIATHWRGWKGEKKWGTLEGEFELSATADSTGHVRLAYSLRPPYTGFHWALNGALELEAGQLDRLAAEVQLAWPAQGAA
jgi:hypothetical protein